MNKYMIGEMTTNGYVLPSVVIDYKIIDRHKEIQNYIITGVNKTLSKMSAGLSGGRGNQLDADYIFNNVDYRYDSGDLTIKYPKFFLIRDMEEIGSIGTGYHEIQMESVLAGIDYGVDLWIKAGTRSKNSMLLHKEYINYLLWYINRDYFKVHQETDLDIRLNVTASGGLELGIHMGKYLGELSNIELNLNFIGEILLTELDAITYVFNIELFKPEMSFDNSDTLKLYEVYKQKSIVAQQYDLYKETIETMRCLDRLMGTTEDD